MRALRALLAPKVGLLAFLAYALFVLVYGLWPLELRLDPGFLRDKWARTEWEVLYRTPSGGVLVDADLVLNVLFFIPLGAAFSAMTRPRGALRAAAFALLAGAALSLLVEGLQVLTPTRTTQLADLWRNALGACLGSGLAQPALAALERWTSPERGTG